MRHVIQTACILLLWVFGGAVAYGAETIPTFDARILVSENGTIEVTEAIVYDFGNNKRHGIFRNIPYSYQAGTETYTADISSVLVTDGRGSPRPFQESRGNGELELKIGDPEKEITGTQTYVISYVVEGPFLYFDDHDEFYWNVTGSWPQKIQKASVLVDLPRGTQVLNAACYKGEQGDTEPCDSDERLVNVERAGYTATAQALQPNEGFTVAVAFPKGTIQKVEKKWNMREKIPPYAYWPFGIPVLAFFALLYLWYTRGRDPKGKTTIVTEFSPPLGVSPALASVLKNEWATAKDVSAEIVRLATEGYIKIYRYETKVLFFTNTDYLLEAQRDTNPEDPIGSLVMDKLFQDEFIDTVEIEGEEKTGVLISKMQHKFVEEKKDIIKRIYDEAVLQDFFAKRPDIIRRRYILGGVLGIVLGIGCVTLLFDSVQGMFFGIAVVISGIFVAIAGNWMPVKTKEGVRVREHLEGFKRYLEVAEKDRIAFHDSPEKAPSPQRNIELFSMYLPYAMMFGIEEEWATQFDDIFAEEPDWYHSTSGQAFSAGVFTADIASFTSDFGSAMAPQSSGASGGGSVGGGFGGGGGGSW
jgi:hypothetical protein